MITVTIVLDNVVIGVVKLLNDVDTVSTVVEIVDIVVDNVSNDVLSVGTLPDNIPTVRDMVINADETAFIDPAAAPKLVHAVARFSISVVNPCRLPA